MQITRRFTREGQDPLAGITAFVGGVGMIVSDTLIVAFFVWLIARELKVKDRVVIRVGQWRIRAENFPGSPRQARKKGSSKPALKNQKSKPRRKKKPPP